MKIDPATRRLISDLVDQRVANLIRMGRFSRSSSDGEEDGIEGHETPPGEEGYDYDVVRGEPFGLRSVPVPEHVEGVVVHIHGGQSSGYVVATHNTKYGPSNLAEGEVAIYNKATGCLIKLDANGKITIDAASGQDVQVNGGSLKVARVTDATTGHVHAAGTLMCPNTGTGVAVAVTGSTASATDTIASGGGATRFKA